MKKLGLGSRWFGFNNCCYRRLEHQVRTTSITYFSVLLQGFEDKSVPIDERDLQQLGRERGLHLPLPDYLDANFRRHADEYMTQHSPITSPVTSLAAAKTVYINLVRYLETILSS